MITNPFEKDKKEDKSNSKSKKDNKKKDNAKKIEKTNVKSDQGNKTNTKKSNSKNEQKNEKKQAKENLTCETFKGDIVKPNLYFGNYGLGDVPKDSKGFGLNVAQVNWEMINAKADYKYGGASLGAVKLEGSAAIDTKKGVNLSAMASCVNGEVYGRIPLFNDKKLKIGVQGYVGAGAEFKVSNNKFKVGLASLVGGSLSFELE